jgi:hypothetical protein
MPETSSSAPKNSAPPRLRVNHFIFTRSSRRDAEDVCSDKWLKTGRKRSNFKVDCRFWEGVQGAGFKARESPVLASNHIAALTKS